MPGPTDEGFRIIGVWESEDAWQRFRKERLAPDAEGVGQIPPTFRALRATHIVQRGARNPTKDAPMDEARSRWTRVPGPVARSLPAGVVTSTRSGRTPRRCDEVEAWRREARREAPVGLTRRRHGGAPRSRSAARRSPRSGLSPSYGRFNRLYQASDSILNRIVLLAEPGEQCPKTYARVSWPAAGVGGRTGDLPPQGPPQARGRSGRSPGPPGSRREVCRG
jgi:hypothetical protein